MTSTTRTEKAPRAAVPAPEETEPETGEQGEYRDLLLTQLVVNPKNIRKQLLDIPELAASINEVGILQPLTVRPHGPDSFEICYGHRRFAAAQLANLTSVPCRIRELDDVQLLKSALIENIHHDHLTYLALSAIASDASFVAVGVAEAYGI